jgi:hypothetical protein
MKNQININNITDNEPKINIPKLKEEKTEKSFIDTIIDFFKPTKSENIKLNTNDELSNIRGGYIKCNCPKTHSKFYCDNIYEIIGMLKGNQDIDSEKSKKLYEGLLHICDRNLDANGENILQIKKDLHRTFPSSTIMKSKHIQNRLKNVLRAFSNYEPNVKYFQGMNFIVGFLLYHCDENIAFWLFVALFEEYNYREIFAKNFPGLKVHVEKVKSILKNYSPILYQELAQANVTYEIFMIEWLYSLFSSIIPLELQMGFYKGFYCEGWKFFYKMCICIITSAKGTFRGPEEIYIMFKFGTLDDKVTDEFTDEYWKKIINNAYNIDIDEFC